MDESVLTGYANLELTTTTNIDFVLESVLQSLKLDVEGRLVKFLTVRGVCFFLSLIT